MPLVQDNCFFHYNICYTHVPVHIYNVIERKLTIKAQCMLYRIGYLSRCFFELQINYVGGVNHLVGVANNAIVCIGGVSEDPSVVIY